VDEFTKVTQISQQLEQLLANKYGAEGRGLHEKLTSVEGRIPGFIQKKIRYIATMRNKATHEDVKIAKQNYASIKKAYDEVSAALDDRPVFWKILVRKLALAASLAIVFYIFYRFRMM